MSRLRELDIKFLFNIFDGTFFFYICLVLRFSFKEFRFCMFVYSTLVKVVFFFKWIKVNRILKRYLCMYLIIDLRLVCFSLYVNYKDTYF